MKKKPQNIHYNADSNFARFGYIILCSFEVKKYITEHKFVVKSHFNFIYWRGGGK